MEEENIKLVGKVELVHQPYGNVYKIPNTVVTQGKAIMAGLLAADVGGTGIDYLGIGVGSSTIAAGNTSLGSQIVRNPTTGTRTTTTTTQDTAQFIGSFGISGTWVVNEAGLFNAASAGSLFSRTTFAGISVVSGDSINATWTVQFS